MKWPKTLDELETHLNSYIKPLDVFDGDVEANTKHLQFVCHPDRNPGDDKAKNLWKLIEKIGSAC